ncbi:4-hydroxy-tetrahydrodipicolinate reductase [Alkaliphilus peptidifermentans]|uniref:4-hydroxy-tetrahydrodipicolinate reductase n=1 Tax=Alkaliphilus peptidifermentans DSM 18978 TaxID=1120976 RepID=A0A1G5CIT9_9FIRM|nr:4-hydroxy-tetrahydrodipicolinate reductase [Alkaliphilus peptidifermentans]SCY02234.1 dihydrodipicolinate reductase [Alkaliphilus peptidifermentans DSM 18978]
MNLYIWGINGRMGQNIYRLGKEDSYWSNIAGVNRNNPVERIDFKADVVIDFSHPSAIDHVLKYCIDNQTPLVIGTTGFEEEGLLKIKNASKLIPILHATNMSLGMNIMFSLVEQISAMLQNKVDIEVIEAHHNRKMDAPSGSARTIVEAIEAGLGTKTKHQHGREGQCPREKGEIGIHAIRGGNIVGLHEAHFINDLETVKIVHEAHDRSVFAQGALEAAKYIAGKANGLYNMKNVLGLN